jgi:hypothetical protein
MIHMGIACGSLIIHLPVIIYFLEGPFMGLSSAQAAGVSHGVVAVVESSAVGEGFAGGSGKEWVAWNYR